MKKINLMILLAMCFEFFLVYSCSEKEKQIQKEKKFDKDLVLKGSDSEYELMKRILKNFKNENPDITFEIGGGGSAKGIDALINGEINIATSSREMTNAEFEGATNESINPVPLIFALDAVAFITHPQNGVDSLSPDQLYRIYSGEIKNWKELGGVDLPVKLFGRDHHSGTNGYLLNRLHLESWSKNVLSFEHNVDVYEKVKLTKGSIGYVSLGTIVSSFGKPVVDVWAINVYTDYSHSISPYELAKVQNGDYYFSRPLYLYFNGIPKGKIRKFSQFILSENVQNTLWENGYFPISEQHKKLNSKNNLTP